MRRAAAAVCVLGLMSGCFASTVRTGLRESGGSRVNIGVSFLWGFTPTAANAADCRYGIAQTTTFLPAWGVFVAWLTAGIVIPWEMVYWCADPLTPAS